MLKKALRFLSPGSRDVKLEDRLLRVSSLVIALLVIPTMIINFLTNMHWALNVVLLVPLTFYSFLLWYTRKHPVTKTIQVSFFLCAVVVMFPLWFLNGGLLGTMTPYLFLLFLMGAYISERSSQRMVLGIYFAMLAALFTLEFMVPEWVVPHASESLKKIDMISGVVLASGAIAAMVITFRVSFIKERNALLKTQSELQETNKKLIEARNLSESANRTKSVFLANMSHEIRTPLNSIIGAIDLIQGSKMTADQRDLVKLMEESSGNLLQLLTDILDLSKIEAKKVSIKIEPINLKELVVNMVNFGRSMNIKVSKSLNVTGHVSDEVAAYIASDHTRLTQVITNLMSNAIKYSERGTVELNIYLGDQNAMELVIEVRDEGIGIKKELMEFIYEPFSQVGELESQNVQGVGLGLAITKSILELMNGRLEVESQPGVGSSFKAIIPYEPTSPAERGPEHDIDYRNQFQGYHFLLVEDNKINQIIITKMMQELGASTKLAASGHIALEMLKTESFDCILMDLNMPGIDGIETTDRLRNMPGLENQLVIAVTANVLAKDEQRCIDAGLNGYLSKPLTIASLGAKLAEILPKHSEV